MEKEESVNLKIHPNDEMMNYVLEIGYSEDGYFNQGKLNALAFRDAIKQFKPSLLSGKHVLDYGCGHGRVCRYFPNLLSPSKFVVADVWDDAVNFCAEEFNAASLLMTDEKTLSTYNTKFDVILSYSVFTHLPPASFKFILSEISKCLTKDSIFLFTTKGEFDAKNANVSLDDGFNFVVRDVPNETKGRLSGSKYAEMFVNSQYVENILNSVGLKLIDHKPDWMTHQDLYVAEPL